MQCINNSARVSTPRSKPVHALWCTQVSPLHAAPCSYRQLQTVMLSHCVVTEAEPPPPPPVPHQVNPAGSAAIVCAAWPVQQAQPSPRREPRGDDRCLVIGKSLRLVYSVSVSERYGKCVHTDAESNKYFCPLNKLVSRPSPQIA